MRLHPGLSVGLPVAVVLTLLAARLQPAQAAEVAIPRIDVAPATTAEIAVWLSPAPDRVSALQFDLVYDADALTVEAKISDVAQASGKEVYTAGQDRGVLRVVIAGMNGEPIAAGSLVLLSVRPAETVKGGAFDLRLSAPVAATPEGDTVPLTTIDGQITFIPADEPVAPPEVQNARSAPANRPQPKGSERRARITAAVVPELESHGRRTRRTEASALFVHSNPR